MRPHDSGRPKWKRNEQGPRTAFPLVRGLDRLSQQSAPGGIRTPNLLIRNQMLYPLSYGRSAASGIPVRNGAKHYRFTLPRRKSAPLANRLPAWERSATERSATERSATELSTLSSVGRELSTPGRLEGWTLGTQPLDLGHGFAQPAQPFVAVLPHQTHAPGERL